jgi:cell division protein FtsW
MTALLARTNRTLIGEWWWTLDKILLGLAIALLLIGAVLVFAASPPVAERVFGSEMHYVKRHLIILPVAALLLIGMSLLSARGVFRVSVLLFAVFYLLLVLTLLIGPEIKGAQRWLIQFGFQLQPSEIVKPALFVLTAYILTRETGWRGRGMAIGLAGCVLVVLARQPDLGMAILIAAVLCAQLFVAGLGWTWVVLITGAGLGSMVLAYNAWPHFALRIDRFLDPNNLGYQVERALGAVSAGGFAGTGPGEGVVKYHLPDAHSDFIFAATAEEFGILTCLIIAGIFAFLFFRAISRLESSSDRFVLIAGTGLATAIGLQAIVNMAVNLNLMPTKGMTLPFISYGGSSMVGTAIAMGLLLAITRRRARLDLAP